MGGLWCCTEVLSAAASLTRYTCRDWWGGAGTSGRFVCVEGGSVKRAQASPADARLGAWASLDKDRLDIFNNARFALRATQYHMPHCLSLSLIGSS